MNLAFFTNNYLPFLGGVALSVKTLEDECRARGHQVRIVAPEMEDTGDEEHVLRVPAIKDFNQSGFSFRIPVPNLIRDDMDDFCPELVHSHHPFLLGDAALREAWKMRVPLVFTHHTLYEQYTHYLPIDSPAIQRAAIQLDTEYCNLCDRIVAPSESVRDLLVSRGVTTPIEAIPTGVDVAKFASGNRDELRAKLGFAKDHLVLGHVGRLANEKNLPYLVEAIIRVLTVRDEGRFLLVGDGEARDDLSKTLAREFGPDRIHVVGSKSGQDLLDCYAAMDLFVFSSQSETQGMVLAEAMAAGNPVVALDGPGVREILRDDENGRLLPGDAGPGDFALAVGDAIRDPAKLASWRRAARTTAQDFSTANCVEEMLACYGRALAGYETPADTDRNALQKFVDGTEAEWDLIAAKFSAALAAATGPSSETP